MILKMHSKGYTIAQIADVAGVTGVLIILFFEVKGRRSLDELTNL